MASVASPTRRVCRAHRERARHTIEDFVLSYLPLHGLDTRDFLARDWPLLVYVEGTM